MSKEFCPHCHQSIMQNKQFFTKALGDILLLAATVYPYGKSFHLQKDLLLTKSQYNNFQKLRYWGLVKKSYTPEGKRIGGCWELTSLVRYFVNGSALPRIKWTFNNEVVDRSTDDQITLSQAVGSFKVPEWWADNARPVKKLLQETLFT